MLVLKHRAKKQEKYLWTLFTPGNPSDESQLAVKSAQKLSECGNYLLFKNYFTVGEIRLSNMQTCQQHLLCPFCAALRASKSMQKYMDRIIQVMKENKKLKPVMITFTVKNGADLKERFYHLMGSFRTLLDRRRDYLKKVVDGLSSARLKALYILTKTPKTKKLVNGIRTFICSL